jgi:hypothetical protein
MKVLCPEVLIEDIVLRNGSVDEPGCKYAKDCCERIRLQQEQSAAKRLIPKKAKKLSS